MKIPKPSDADRARFQSLVPDDDRVEVKPMFGNLGAFVNGNMFMGLFGPDVGVKLADADQQQLVEAGGGSFGPEERPMAGYVTVPPALAAPQAQRWVARSLEYVAGLPQKKKRPPKRT
jgi:TfoX/Sxy family transcriptional regulator of competence genes